MSTELTKLKGKGAPPPIEDSPDVIATDTRGEAKRQAAKPAPNVGLQLMVSAADFAAFSEQAMREFGFSKGAKSNLFKKMWATYQGSMKS